MLKIISFLLWMMVFIFSTISWAKPFTLVDHWQQQTRVVALASFLQAPYVIARYNRKIYVRGLTAPRDTCFVILRRGISLTDPDSNDDLGTIAHYVATVRLVSNGDPTVLQLMKHKGIIRSGDRLFLPLNKLRALTLHKVTKKVDAQIIATVKGNNKISLYDKVVVNYGKDNGASPGQIFTIVRMPTLPLVQFIHSDRSLSLNYQKVGSLVVTQSFSKVSFAIILTMKKPINILDHIISPSFENLHAHRH